MTSEIVDRVRRSSRYRSVDPALLARLAAEELPKSRNADDAVKRVKRRLHQAVGAFRAGTRTELAWPVDDPVALRTACLDAMRQHASTRERIEHLDTFYPGIWQHTGVPRSVLDLGCGLGPLALPWMKIGDAFVHGLPVHRAALLTSRGRGTSKPGIAKRMPPAHRRRYHRRRETSSTALHNGASRFTS